MKKYKIFISGVSATNTLADRQKELKEDRRAIKDFVRGRNLMAHKESETIEFKKSTAEIREAVISVVAMLNKYGRGEAVGNSLCHRDYSNPKGNEVAALILAGIGRYPVIEIRDLKSPLLTIEH